MRSPMTVNRHRIQKQIIELTVNSEASGPVLQESLARSCRQQLAADLSAAFDALAPAHVLRRIDRLEIDVGQLVGADWEPQLRRKLVAELSRRLVDAGGAGTSTWADDEAASVDPLAQFLFFLAHGRLPWWGKHPEQGWDVLFEGRSSSGEWQQLLTTLRDHPHARTRCVASLGDAVLDNAVTIWCALPHAATVLEVLSPRSSSIDIARRWRRSFWLLLLDRAVSRGPALHRGPELLQALLQLRRALESRMLAAISPSIADIAGRADPLAVGSEFNGGDLPQPWRDWHARAMTAQHSSDQENKVSDDQLRRSRMLHAVPDRPATGRSTVEILAEEQAIYLSGAGIVLIHPFLETLFRDRQLLEGHGFRDDAARQHAVQLLGFLGHGCADAPEYELGIAKLLAGHPLEEPVEPAMLHEPDIAACDALLTAVLGHWTALRSSSTAWLRTQFFLRDAKLEAVDSGYRLTVERRAQDVLLARLPWGFGVIGLPWMREKIFVQWLD